MMNEEKKEIGTVTDKEASIIHSSCVCVWRMQLYIHTPNKPQQELVVFGHRFISKEFFFTSQAKKSYDSTLSKCTNKALGGCCNYFSGFRPGNPVNFLGGSPKRGGKPELSLNVSSAYSSTQALVHFIYIRISKGTNVILPIPQAHMAHFPALLFITCTHITFFMC